ncbi:MAG: helix-turn-helix domain-containing protein [Syntrophobacterales bacterium]|nr:helix-turn-helix domain-containing protein [Syntrophobacterales bacterium]
MERRKVSSGVGDLDRLLGGLYIGDNVIWYDEVGMLAGVFVENFLQTSLEMNKPIVYISFDRSPRNLITRLRHYVESEGFIVVDCFTNGKGERAEIFEHFYEEDNNHSCRIIKLENPWSIEELFQVITSLQKDFLTDTRFVFDSLTGMQDLWGDEEKVLKFYGHACPRLYELNTVAYWIVDKLAHSERLKSRLNHITQVAIELTSKSDKMILTVLKAEDRSPELLNRPIYFMIENGYVRLTKTLGTQKIDLGTRISEIRKRRGISQKELAQMIGVTPSTISQLESNRIYPSIPALIKIAEILGVSVGYFFGKALTDQDVIVLPERSRIKIQLGEFLEESIEAYSLIPLDVSAKAEPYLIEIPQGKVINTHFFIHKGEELGYVLRGKLQMTVRGRVQIVSRGDTIFLSSEIPSQWKNVGQGTAQLLWIKVK